VTTATPWTGPLPLPRASDHAVAGFGRACLKLFLAAQFLSLTRLFFVAYLGDGVTPVATLAGVASVALLLPAVLVYGLRSGSVFGNLIPAAQHWVVAVTGLALLLFAYGWLGKGYSVNACVHDLGPYVVIVACTILGSQRAVWEDTNRFLLVLFAAALVVNVLAMSEITNVVSESYADDRSGTTVLGYRTQGALAFWPLLLLTARLRRTGTALLVFAGVFFVLAQQVLFQKRAPTVRVLLVLAVFLFVLPRLLPRGRKDAPSLRERWIRVGFLTTGAAAVVVCLTLAPWLFRGQASGLVNRLSGQAYSSGASGILYENERFFEVAMFFRTLLPQEYVLGRGFGGYFAPDTEGWGGWLEDVNEVGRRALHVGALMPFFKGGLVLTLAYYTGLFLVLFRGRKALHEPLAAAAFWVVLIHALFLVQEGWFILSGSFDLVMVAFCMGHLLSRERTLDGFRRLQPVPAHARASA
jgi:hypothetical protein